MAKPFLATFLAAVHFEQKRWSRPPDAASGT